jgi:chromosome segregation ATPase
MKKFLAYVLGLTLVVIIAADHFAVVKELNRLQRSKEVVAQQRFDLRISQEGVVNLTVLLREANSRIKNYQAYIAELQKTQKQTQTVVEHSADTIKDLTNENANLQRQLDSWKERLERYQDVTRSLMRDKDTLKEKLQKVYFVLRKTEEDLQYCRDAYKRATGKDLPGVR